MLTNHIFITDRVGFDDSDPVFAEVMGRMISDIESHVPAAQMDNVVICREYGGTNGPENQRTKFTWFQLPGKVVPW